MSGSQSPRPRDVSYVSSMFLTQVPFPNSFPPAEKDFLLIDRETEAKYSFKMTKTLERARKNKGKLLEGKTFYLTQKVDVDSKLMKSVVAAHGGTVRFPRLFSVTSTHPF
jgi:hypothetical protein